MGRESDYVLGVASPALPLTRSALTVLAVGLSLWLTGCDHAPSASGLPEWTPKDHDRNEENTRAAQGQAPSSARPRKATPEEDAAQVAELTWSTQCANCHGPLGRGDGPTGAMVKAPDLTRADFQERVNDAAMAATIRSGKGQMPKFDLSDAVTAALVKRIRKNRAP